MKSILSIAFIILTLAVLPSHAATKEEQARAFYQQGVTAMKAGNISLAKENFRQVLRLYPGHPTAIRQLAYIESNHKELVRDKRERQLKAIIIPEINLEKTSLEDAVAVLFAQVKRESKGQVAPNIIIQERNSNLKNKNVTLELTRIPADTILRYIADQVGAKIRYDKHAIVLTPR